MSHILSQWLNTDVGLSRPVASSEMDAAFRSGYLFAELLEKQGLVENLGAFQEISTTTAAVAQQAAVPTTQHHPHHQPHQLDSIIKNFTLLEPLLRGMGTLMSPHMAYDVIQGKEGCAARLLYQIKTSLVHMKTRQMEEAAAVHNNNNNNNRKLPLLGRGRGEC